MIAKMFIDLVRKARIGSDGTYHPERHYMRGRGPAWHKKNQPARNATATHDPAHDDVDSPNTAIS
jgi:hypothetical protein